MISISVVFIHLWDNSLTLPYDQVFFCHVFRTHIKTPFVIFEIKLKGLDIISDFVGFLSKSLLFGEFFELKNCLNELQVDF